MSLFENSVFIGFTPFLIAIVSIGLIIGLFFWKKQQTRLINALEDLAYKRNGEVVKKLLFNPYLKFQYLEYTVELRPLQGRYGMFTNIDAFTLPLTPRFFVRRSFSSNKLITNCNDELFTKEIFTASIEDKLISFGKKFFTLLLDRCKLNITLEETFANTIKPEDYDIIIGITIDILNKIKETKNKELLV